jgi:hypothetical protein
VVAVLRRHRARVLLKYEKLCSISVKAACAI